MLMKRYLLCCYHDVMFYISCSTITGDQCLKWGNKVLTLLILNFLQRKTLGDTAVFDVVVAVM